MKLNFLHSFWAAALLLAVVSCTREELPSASCEDGVRPLSITVADGGYGAADGQTKAVENGCRTEFTAGDECGLYIVRGGTVVYNNVKLTATSSADGSLTWQPEAGTELGGGLDGETYCLYCPYQADMSGKVDVTATDAEGFFAPLVSGWQPEADQSTYANYTASDLMTAKGTATKGTDGTLSLSFSMTHRMALAVIEMPPTVYKFTDTAIPDYTGGGSSADFTSSAVKPYCIAPGTYRCIFNPASGTATSITGSYADGWKEFTVTPDGIAANCCRTYRIDGLNPTEKSYSLQVGDYFCRNSIGLWYIIPKAEKPGNECIGAVFYVGQHPNDASDYSDTGIGQKNCRGYAVALKDANAQECMCMWGAAGKELGCYPKDGSGNKPDNIENPDLDWSGYDWTRKIISNGAGGVGDLNGTSGKGYPATYYAVVEYQNKISAPTGSSGWFLPSVGQMWAVYLNRDSLFADKSVATGLRFDDQYWSSSEYSFGADRYALIVCPGLGRVNGIWKDYCCYVRPVLAF